MHYTISTQFVYPNSISESKSDLESDNMLGITKDIPLDLIFRILLLLPVASLCRLKLVCRSWLALIESSDFVRQHLDFSSSKKGNPHFIVLNRPNESNHRQVSLVSANTSKILDVPFISDPYRINLVNLVGSSNGVICLRQGRGICLWNPATKQSTNVTIPVVPLEPLEGYGLFLGFVCDAVTNDYKLVCINIGLIHYSSHVYTSHNDYWRTIDDRVLCRMIIYMGLKTPYRGRFYCMLCFSYEDSVNTILTFDFGEEEFRVIPFPLFLICANIEGLFILSNNIACISEVKNAVGDWSESPQDWHFEIWMLSDYDDYESWTKVYSVDPLVIHSRPVVGFSDNGDFLLFVEDARLRLYDLVTQQAMNLPVQVNLPIQDNHVVEVVPYGESLVSVKRGNSRTDSATFVGENGRMFIIQTMTRNNNRCAFDIPEIVIFRILLWLPVKSLLRFKSVCKSWCSLIKSSDFVAQHLHQKGNKNINLILYCRSRYDQLYEDSSHPSLKTSPACLLSPDKFELLDFPYHQDWGHGQLRILTSFNGVICLVQTEDYNVYLWNPATKQFRVVLVEQEQVELEEVEPREYNFGFGFDVKTQDYKLVRFLDRDNSFVQVYNLSTDSWRTIEDDILPTVSVVHNHSSLQAPNRSGTYCWLAYIDRGTGTILTFDFSDEVFGTLPMPDTISKLSECKLAIISENIACIGTYKEDVLDVDKNWHCEIWMMNEYGVKESWTKLYTVGPFPEDWCVLPGYLRMNRDYILLQEVEHLYSCDLVTQETKRFPRQVQLHGGKQEGYSCEFYFEVAIYEESLVPIKRGHC